MDRRYFLKLLGISASVPAVFKAEPIGEVPAVVPTTPVLEEEYELLPDRIFPTGFRQVDESLAGGFRSGLSTVLALPANTSEVVRFYSTATLADNLSQKFKVLNLTNCALDINGISRSKKCTTQYCGTGFSNQLCHAKLELANDWDVIIVSHYQSALLAKLEEEKADDIYTIRTKLIQELAILARQKSKCVIFSTAGRHRQVDGDWFRQIRPMAVSYLSNAILTIEGSAYATGPWKAQVVKNRYGTWNAEEKLGMSRKFRLRSLDIA